MNRVVIDDALRSKLDEFRIETELCDKSGNVIGLYKPATDPNRHWYEWEKRHFTPQDEAEMERRCNEPGERTTAEVLKALQQQ